MKILRFLLCFVHGALALSPLSAKASLHGREAAASTHVQEAANATHTWRHGEEFKTKATANLLALGQRAQSAIMDSAALLRTAQLNPMAVVSSLVLDIVIVGACFVYVNQRWAEWTKMHEPVAVTHGSVIDEAVKQMMKLFERNQEAVDSIIGVCVEFPLMALFPTLGVLSILELLLSASLAYDGCGVPLIGWMQVDAVVALGCAGIACPAFAVVKDCLANPLQVADAVRKWYQSGISWPALLEVLLPGRKLDDYQVVCVSLFASAAFMLTTFVWSMAGAAILLQGIFTVCSLQIFTSALLLIVLRFVLSYHWVTLVWQHRSILLYDWEASTTPDDTT